jgi:hypothetical protein
MNSREYIKQRCFRMSVTERIEIARHIFEDAFPCGFFSIYKNHEQAFLSTMPGSGCGAYRVHRDPLNGNFIVSKHPESDKRYYVDPDREYLFNRLPDGTLERKA